MSRLFVTFCAVLFACLPAVAETSLPTNAKKLSAAEILALHGTRVSFDNKEFDATLTGTVYYLFKDKLVFGTSYWNNENKGLFRFKTWIKGDQSCQRAINNKEDRCVFIYRAGDTLFDVNKNGKVLGTNVILPSDPPLPPGLPKIDATRVLELVKGKRIIVEIFDFGGPLIADVKWDLKKKKSTGKYMFGAKEGKANAKYVVKNDTLCFPEGKKDNCYDYYETKDGFIEVNAEGKVHGISVFQ